MSIPELPNPNEWQPRASATETLQIAFLKSCLATERSVQLRVQAEKEMNIDNFDSGVGVEDIIREELKRILPARYAVECGALVDRDGKTSGDHEILIFNRTWFPRIKPGATASSRRTFFPIEGVYAVGEIKQTIDYSTLDKAMEKLVVAHRLNRPSTFAKRLAENRESTSCSHGLSNPLFSFILGVNIGSGIRFEDLINRFYDINRRLKRAEVVRAMCVLGEGTVIWGFRDELRGGTSPALFMLEDLYLPLIPIYYRAEEIGSALFALVGDLMLHLFHSVLAPEDIAVAYGPPVHAIKAPKSLDIYLPPDPDRLESLKNNCPDFNCHSPGRTASPG